jgi:predicted nucleotidyltransferase
MHKKVKEALETIDLNTCEFVYLLGSYARNEQTEYSDIDIKVALKEGYDGSFVNRYVNGTNLSIKYDSLEEMKEYVSNPSTYIQAYPGIKDMIVLYDEEQYSSEFRNKFLQIDYSTYFEKEINQYVNKEVIDWVEEVNKSLNGLLLHDDDKLLAGLHGLTYGMLHVFCVSEGIMYSSKGILDTMKKHFKSNSTIYKLIERAYGVKKHSLKTRTLKGLRLYLELIDLMKYRFTEETQEQLVIVKKNIVKALINYS